jgi:regulator of nonsense transcripts 1
VGKANGTLTTFGREKATSAEKQRGEAVLQVLQGNSQLIDDNPWLQKICFPSDDFCWPSSFSTSSTSLPPELDFSTLERPLNTSQCDAVKHMLSSANDSRITLIHGPPGTGKTTVIATYVHFAISQGQRGIWLTAQSNVAVKNIAEKLSDSGFMNWRLLVSKDFHHEWYVLFSVIYEPSLLTGIYT